MSLFYYTIADENMTRNFKFAIVVILFTTAKLTYMYNVVVLQHCILWFTLILYFGSHRMCAMCNVKSTIFTCKKFYHFAQDEN